ncbi:hypothetical protein ON010_g8432 [Phytophthora cinnamomi]|nr:hypothetical protein ON010_g8432 [Phytophthora cinnamomi]
MANAKNMSDTYGTAIMWIVYGTGKPSPPRVQQLETCGQYRDGHCTDDELFLGEFEQRHPFTDHVHLQQAPHCVREEEAAEEGLVVCHSTRCQDNEDDDAPPWSFVGVRIQREHAGWGVLSFELNLSRVPRICQHSALTLWVRLWCGDAKVQLEAGDLEMAEDAPPELPDSGKSSSTVEFWAIIQLQTNLALRRARFRGGARQKAQV